MVGRIYLSTNFGASAIYTIMVFLAGPGFRYSGVSRHADSESDVRFTILGMYVVDWFIDRF